MEEHNSSLSSQESAAAHSASALRELQQRAHTTLASSREQAARLEAEINQQLDAIAATLSEQNALDAQSSVEAGAYQAEVMRLTEELEHLRADWQADRIDLEAERESLTQKLGSVEEARSELAQQFTELEIEREILVQKVAKLATQSDDISPKLSTLETEREALAHQVTSLEAEREDLVLKITSLETEKGALSTKVIEQEGQRQGLADKLDAAEIKRDELFQQLTNVELQREDLYQKISKLESHNEDVSPKVISLEAQRDELSQKVNGLETDNVKLSGKIASFETERRELNEKIVGLESTNDDLAKKVARLETERDDLTQIASNYEVQRNDLTANVAALESERDDLSRNNEALEAKIQSSQADWRNQLLDFESRLRDQQGSWTEQRSEWAQTRAGLERERDELQQKFDLALEDLQRLRARGAELEQDLARRPEATQADSAELVALRAERDALAARVEELEQRPAAQIDDNVEQQLSDLRRRFELAVEDLREYKTKNAQLESQLAAAGSQSGTQKVDAGGNDWESQKRRLLASLEENADAQETPIQKQNRITIEGTIEMTDAVVAEKDRQIADLQAKLAAAGDGALCEAEHARKINDLVDTDAIIAGHRNSVRELEREMQEKLRAAELELSVERAKMARQKAELEELKSDLESKRQDFESNGVAPAPGQPKRRWRDKLGLSGDE